MDCFQSLLIALYIIFRFSHTLTKVPLAAKRRPNSHVVSHRSKLIECTCCGNTWLLFSTIYNFCVFVCCLAKTTICIRGYYHNVWCCLNSPARGRFFCVRSRSSLVYSVVRSIELLCGQDYDCLSARPGCFGSLLCVAVQERERKW